MLVEQGVLFEEYLGDKLVDYKFNVIHGNIDSARVWRREGSHVYRAAPEAVMCHWREINKTLISAKFSKLWNISG